MMLLHGRVEVRWWVKHFPGGRLFNDRQTKNECIWYLSRTGRRIKPCPSPKSMVMKNCPRIIDGFLCQLTHENQSIYYADLTCLNVVWEGKDTIAMPLAIVSTAAKERTAACVVLFSLPERRAIYWLQETLLPKTSNHHLRFTLSI